MLCFLATYISSLLALTVIVLIAIIIKIYQYIFRGECYHCKKEVYYFDRYYTQRTDFDNMYLSKSKDYGRPYHKKCCEENEPLFKTTKWDDKGFKVI